MNSAPVIIHTDGGCSGNPGPGAWAAVLTHGGLTLEVVGGELETTNNRMEISAAIGALKALNRPCQVVFHTDSQYLRNGITQWIASWKRNGWRTRDREPVKNADLWRELDELVQQHRVTWQWVKGHAGDVGNERCDTLARREIKRLKSQGRKAAS